MSDELENIENVEEVEVIPTDNTTEELQENVEQSTGEVSGEVSGEVTEVPEDNSAEIEAEQERLRREHEEYLNSFPETTVFYRDLLVNGNVKSLGNPTKNPRVAESYGYLEQHFDESELTYIGTPECGIWYLKGYEKLDPTLAELKAQKLAELSNITDKFEQNKCSEMYFTSSLGFRVNGDRRSVQNIESLITIGEPTRFKDYDNKLHPDFSVPVPDFSVEKLNILKLEIAKNGEDLYQQKFLYEYRIQTATTPEELNFDMVFEMSDFSA